MHSYAIAAFVAAATPLVAAVASQTYTWKSVKIGGGGGFVPGIVFRYSHFRS
jgi:xyloglucan-specific exo-beta-1,4-glucanase